MTPSQFNVRVYGLLMTGGKILVSDERYGQHTFTKFPGGGLEFGEGVLDCLQREFLEEAGQPVTVVEHFYTTEQFFASAFNPQQQILSIYYRVALQGPQLFATSAVPFNFKTTDRHEVVFRWLPLAELKTDLFKFPIDKIVVEKLMAIPSFM